MTTKRAPAAHPSSNGYGEPSSRLAELFAKTVVPEPYQVSDKIIIAPLSKTVLAELNRLNTQINKHRSEHAIGQWFLGEALKRTDTDPAAAEGAIDSLTKVIDVADKALQVAEIAYNRTFFGDQYDDVQAFFADLESQYWDAFCADIRDQLMPSGATGPDTGACTKCGRVFDAEQAGKDLRTLELIDHYWDQIEGDFARHLHVDARDYLRGVRPWDQFLNYCNTVAQIRGGQLYAAQLTDPRYFDEIEKRIEEARAGRSTRPGLEGHTAEIDALYMVANQIRLLIRAQGGEIDFIDGPEGPEELIKARQVALSDALLDAALGYSGGELIAGL